MEFIKTDRAPKAIGPYSQATVINNIVFVSGQLPINMETGQLETESKQATKASLSNIVAILEKAGSSKEKIAKVNVFVRDINQFTIINEAYEEFFGDHKPARALVEVSKLPKDAIIEIEAIAHL